MTEYYSSNAEILWDVFLASVPLLVGASLKPSATAFAASMGVSYWLISTFTTTGLFWYYVVAITAWWALESYGDYSDLIQPGKKPTVTGWLRILLLTKIARVNVLKPPRVRPDESPYRGRLFALRKRRGLRPIVPKVAPSRQADQKASPAMYYRLVHLLRMYQVADSTALRIKMSFLEDGIQALFWNLGDRSPGAINQREEWGGEIVHVHATDGSLHLQLHPEDVKTVIEAGWGERHPLCANSKWFFRFLYHGLRELRLPVPEGWTLVYAPRNNSELDAIRPIVTAAIWYATRGELHPVTINTIYPDPLAGGPQQIKRWPWWEFLYGLIPAPPASRTVAPCTCGPGCSGGRTTVTTSTTKHPTNAAAAQSETPPRGEEGQEEDPDSYDARMDQAMRELDRILEERQREANRRRTSTADGQVDEEEEEDENNAQKSRPATKTDPDSPEVAGSSGQGAGAPISDPGRIARVGKGARRMYPVAGAPIASSRRTSGTGRGGAGEMTRGESDPGLGAMTGRGTGGPRGADGGLHFGLTGRRLGTVLEEGNPAENRRRGDDQIDDGGSNWGEWDDFF